MCVWGNNLLFSFTTSQQMIQCELHIVSVCIKSTYSFPLEGSHENCYFLFNCCFVSVKMKRHKLNPSCQGPQTPLWYKLARLVCKPGYYTIPGRKTPEEPKAKNPKEPKTLTASTWRPQFLEVSYFQLLSDFQLIWK